MKMAKASDADIKMALELSTMLESFERGYFPQSDDDDGDADEFFIDLGSHCQSAMDKILYKLTEGSLFRVVVGMAVLLDPTNEAVDPACDHLEHHPKVRIHDELVEALRSLWNDVSGGPKACGHPFTCTCAGDRVRATLAKIDAMTP